MAYVNKATGHGKTYDQTNFGTRKLAFLTIDMNTDVETNYDTNGSLYQKAVQGLQQLGEVYGIGAPNGQWFTAIMSADTLPMDGQNEQSGDTLGTVKDAIDEVTGGSCTVWNARLNGSSLENNC